MFILLEILLIPLAWQLGKIFANNFEARRPPKIYAAFFGVLMGGTLFAIFAICRFYIGGWLINDPTLRIRVDWFGPLDPPAIFLYMFIGYGGATSFYSRPKD
jgi:hypothetical protein